MCARIRPLPITAMVSAPRTVPRIVPRPPMSAVPPRTTAAITSQLEADGRVGGARTEAGGDDDAGHGRGDPVST